MTLSIEPTSETKKLFENLSKSGKISLRSVFEQIGIIYRKEVDMVFNRQQPRGEGLRWPPLNPEYAARKLKKFGNKPLLRATDTLYESMTRKGAYGNIEEVTDESAVYGSSIPYGIFHDSLEGNRKKLPLRNFSQPSERGVDRMKNTLEVAIIKQFESNGIEVKGGVFK